MGVIQGLHAFLYLNVLKSSWSRMLLSRAHFAINNTPLYSRGVTADMFTSVVTTAAPNMKPDPYLLAF